MISIFGASVTQQKDGYAKYLSNNLSDQVSIHGYGGMHLNNAAICFLNEIIQKHPDVCLIDWFSTGYTETNYEAESCIEYLIYRLSEINCKPIFLFFPHEQDDLRLPFYSFCKNIINKKGAIYIDIRPYINMKKLNGILKDDVHTTNNGSRLYAKIIHNQLAKVLINHQKKVAFTSFLKPKKILVEKTFNNRIELRGNCRIIGFLLTIGPHSGKVNIVNGDTNYCENINDRWCSFNRKHFNISFSITGKACINIVQSPVDKKRYKLIVHEVYFSGENLKIENINDGKRINYLSLKIGNLISRIKQRLRIN